MTLPDISVVQGQIDSLKQALVLAQNAGQTDALPGLQAQLKYWNGIRAQIYAAQDASEKPSGFSLGLSGISDDLQAFLGSEIGKVVTILAVGGALVLFAPYIIRAIGSSGSHKA